MKKFVDILASYGLCCVLLSCMFCLTLFGTLYQVEHGLFEAKAIYFSSWYLQGNGEFVLPFPYFPGGMTCMSLLVVNMSMGGLLRMKISARNFGVVIIHIGIALLLGAGLVKMVTAEEGNLRLVEGEQSRFFRSYHKWEVAIWPLGEGGEAVEYVITNDYLSDLAGTKSRVFRAAGLPFDLTLTNFVRNCRVEPKGPMWQSAGPPADGYGIFELPLEKESEFNVAGMHVSVGDQVGILWGFERQPWTVQVGDEYYAITLRHETYAMPFAIKLLDFIKEDHPGMSMAKSFRSHVLKIDEGGEERILIQMNEPLRQGGLVLFQSSYGRTPRGEEFSVFSVVRNVSDKWPEYSMWVITVGMVVAFGRKIVGFAKTQAKRRAGAEGVA